MIYIGNIEILTAKSAIYLGNVGSTALALVTSLSARSRAGRARLRSAIVSTRDCSPLPNTEPSAAFPKSCDQPISRISAGHHGSMRSWLPLLEAKVRAENGCARKCFRRSPSLSRALKLRKLWRPCSQEWNGPQYCQMQATWISCCHRCSTRCSADAEPGLPVLRPIHPKALQCIRCRCS